jgi:hypothetical protein
MATPRQFNLTVSQSPAPRGSLYLLGCELEEVYSVVPITQGHALAIGMVRYRQELFFGCYADPDALPEVHRLPALIEAELQQLGRATPLAPAASMPDPDKHTRARRALDDARGEQADVVGAGAVGELGDARAQDGDRVDR